MKLISFLLLWSCFYACTSTKTIKESVFKTDSTSTRSNTEYYQFHGIKVKDTVVSIPFKKLEKVFNTGDLKPLYSHDGIPQNRIYTIDTNGLKATITAMVDGALLVTCEADSLKIVIQNLIEKNEIIRINSTKETIERMTYKEAYIKVKTFVVNYWKWIAIAIGLIFILNLINSKILK
jgi:hypothetical protein